MIKFAVRNNLYYPLMLILFTFLRNIIDILLKAIFNLKSPYFTSILIFFSEFLFGSMTIWYNNSSSQNNSKIIKSMGIKLIQRKTKISRSDTNLIIYILIFFASYFDFISLTYMRFYIPFRNKVENDFLIKDVRSLQICISALLCYFTIKTNIARHQIVSLIIISFCSITLFSTEIIKKENEITEKLINLGFTLISCTSRALFDTTEKYLLDYNFIDPFLLLLLEGIICFGLMFSCIFIDNNFKIEFEELMNISEKKYLLIGLFIIYAIFSGMKNIYRIITNKFYSPMTRALAESILDPLFTIYYFFFEIRDEKFTSKFWIYFVINFICSIIMALCSSIYNEFIILYYCGLEYETFFEIRKRSINIELNNGGEEVEETNGETENDLSYTVIQYSNNFEKSKESHEDIDCNEIVFE